MDKQSSIVTGGAGFIGSNLVNQLIDLNYNVTIIDNLSSGKVENLNPKAKFFNLDICDYNSIKSLFKDIDYVFHLAAESNIQKSLENPSFTCKTNIEGTCNILKCSLDNGVKKVIFSSTSAVYGQIHNSPLSEHLLESPINPYSISKYSAEKFCEMYSRLYGLETIILRYFNVYGPNQLNSGQYAPVMSLFLNQKSKGEPMTIVGDGTQIRDFVHVNDIVSANLLAANSTNPDIFGQKFNIGSGVPYSILDIKDMIGGDFTFIPQRVGEIKKSYAKIDKAKSLLNWNPRVDLKDWINNIKI